MLGLTKNDWRGLWTILWRVVIFGPFVGLLGLALLLVVMGALILPPCYAVVASLGGDWPYGVLVYAGWVVAVRFGRPFLRWTLQGLEHCSL